MKALVVIITLLLSKEAIAQKTNKVAFMHVNVVDVVKGTVLEDRIVLVDGERIAKIVPGQKKFRLAGYKIVNAKGKFLIPGLIDTHLHLHFLFPNNQYYVPSALKLMIANGLTGFREASGSTYTEK